MFGLELPKTGQEITPGDGPTIFRGNHLRLATARGAFSLLARTLRPRSVWLPSFLCGVVLDCFVSPRVPVRFYRIGRNLRIKDDTWLSKVEQGDLVVFIDYFGFNFWDNWAQEARRRGAWIVEDACHALLNRSFSSEAHFIVASPRKFLGIPDGGVLLAQAGATLPPAPAKPPPPAWWLGALQASVGRREFDRHGGEREWFRLFQKAENEAPVEPSRVSELSSVILDCAPHADAARRRRENYQRLYMALATQAALPELPEGVVPLGFPICSPARDRVRQALFAREIYPPVHWTIDRIVPVEFTESHLLATEIMTLPCDQRYGPAEMDRMVTALREAGMG